MADRTSASAFGDMFNMLASGKNKKLIARALWKMSFKYDFTQDQMGCDNALIKLGLARKAKVTEKINYTDGASGEKKYKVTQYKERDGEEWEELDEDLDVEEP